MTIIQKTLIAVTMVAAVSVGIYEARKASTLRIRMESLRQQIAPLTDQNEQLTRERNDATRQLATLRQENEKLNRTSGELLRLRSEVGLLRQKTNELARLRAAEASARNSQPAQSVVTQPEAIPVPLTVGEIVGIGVALGFDDPTQTIHIVNVLSNSPAAEAGLSAGFVLQNINGLSTKGKSLADCVKLIRGMDGTKVYLELVTPDGNRTATVELTRRKIK